MMFRPQAVIKVGGSLGKLGVLPGLCREIGLLAASYDLLIVPGGGEFADLVRKYYRSYHLSETAAHHMAILAMDQYGMLLGELMPNSLLVRDFFSVSEPHPGRVLILLPSDWLLRADPLPHSWTVTSDSIAAWVAGQLKAQSLILLKDVDGLFSVGERAGELGKLVEQMNVEQLRAQPGGIDESLANVLARLDLETWVINGRHPKRLAELLERGHTIGTRINCSGEQGAAKPS
jgi:aspartokinase-like uncharacterized kinase